MKIKKDKILLFIQKELPLSYEEIKNVYMVTNSYDAIIELNDIAQKHGKDIMELAYFLYGGKDRE